MPYLDILLMNLFELSIEIIWMNFPSIQNKLFDSYKKKIFFLWLWLFRYNSVHNILREMFDKSFVSPQVKRIVILSNKHGIYELSNDLRLRTLGN